MRDRSKLVSLIEQYAYPDYRQMLLDSIQPSIRLVTPEKSSLQIGQTKFGGCPDLPQSEPWPTSSKGEELGFLAQINLAELSDLDLNNQLPNAGILYFFFDLDRWSEGQVIYVPEVISLSKPSVPEFISRERKSFWQRLFKRPGNNFLIEEADVEFHTEYYCASTESLETERQRQLLHSKERWPRIFHEDVFELALLDDPGETELTSRHHLLGRYQGVQHECLELYLAGFTRWRSKPSFTEIEGALQWKLLLQFDSDDKLDHQWGDWGRVYFFIHQDDLKNHDFSKVKVHLDCY